MGIVGVEVFVVGIVGSVADLGKVDGTAVLADGIVVLEVIVVVLATTGQALSLFLPSRQPYSHPSAPAGS